jgi:hypothetical protein
VKAQTLHTSYRTLEHVHPLHESGELKHRVRSVVEGVFEDHAEAFFEVVGPAEGGVVAGEGAGEGT